MKQFADRFDTALFHLVTYRAPSQRPTARPVGARVPAVSGARPSPFATRAWHLEHSWHLLPICIPQIQLRNFNPSWNGAMEPVA